MLCSLPMKANLLIALLVPFFAVSMSSAAESCATVFDTVKAPTTRLQFLEKVTSGKQVENHLWAVHATNYFAENGTLGLRFSKKFLSPTTHFSIGQLVPPHENGSWENRKFAVILPLKALYPQALSVMAVDTFVLGDVHLPRTAVWVIPKNSGIKTNAKTFEFDPEQTTLREAVEAAIESQNGLVLRTRQEFGGEFDTFVSFKDLFLKAKAEKTYFSAKSVNTAEFFESLVQKIPGRSFGAHNRSVVGDAGRFGQIMFWIQGLEMQMSTATSATLLATARVNLNRLDSMISDGNFSPEAMGRYQEYRKLALETMDSALEAQKTKDLSSINFESSVNSVRDEFLQIHLSNLAPKDIGILREHLEFIVPKFFEKSNGDHTLLLTWAMGRYNVLNRGGKVGQERVQSEKLEEIIQTEYSAVRAALETAPLNNRTKEDLIFNLNLAVQTYSFVKRIK
ncbi:hypothetical protein D3C87_241760 [compost metagenome]